MGSLLNRIEAERLTNVRVIRHDAVEVVGTMIAPRSLAGIHVYFPDPWPKKRHHKRRLMTPRFVRELALRLAPGGYLHVATDWEDYAQEMLASVLRRSRCSRTPRTDSRARPSWRPQTKFEKRGVTLGHAVFDLVFRRR